MIALITAPSSYVESKVNQMIIINYISQKIVQIAQVWFRQILDQ